MIDVPTLRLASESQMPQVGLGMWKVDKSRISSLMEEAVKSGYRHFDCACDYGNEAEVGYGLAGVFDSGMCRREDVWITSKLWNTYHQAEHVRLAAERSLADLKTDYLDLYLIHFPIALKYVPFDQQYPPEWIFDPEADQPRMELDRVPISETWNAMEQLVRDGLVRNIGVCNFNCALLRDLMSYAEIPPAVLQVEMHPYLTQDKLVRFCNEQSIAVTAFSPLGANSYFSLNMAEQGDAVLEHPRIREIAAEYGKSPAQIVLRWGIQRGTAVIPKTTRRERLAENISLFDFQLDEQQMLEISEMNQNRRFNDPGVFCDQAFGTFCPIYD